MDDLTDFLPSPIRIFYSYSHADLQFRKELQKRLSVLRRQRIIMEWHDRKIAAGSDWSKEVSWNLEAAHVILLLVSPDFIASDYCYEVEMKRALEKHENGEAKVIPIILRPVDWSATPFGKLQALPKDGKPISTWGRRDSAWKEVARGISSVCWELRGGSEPSGFHESNESNVTHVGGKSQANSRAGRIITEDPEAYFLARRMGELAARYGRGFQRLREGLKALTIEWREQLYNLTYEYEKLKYITDEEGAQKLSEDIKKYRAEQDGLQRRIEEIESAIKSATGGELQRVKKNRKQATEDLKKYREDIFRLLSYIDTVKETVKTPAIEQRFNDLPPRIDDTEAKLNRFNRLLFQVNKLEYRLLKTIPADRDSLSNRKSSAERIDVIKQLNKLSHDALGSLFNDLCRIGILKHGQPRIIHSLLPAIDFQPRPELDALTDWWIDEWNDGVLSLIGLGGSGKTALAYEFVTLIRRGSKLSPQFNEQLPTPELLFVWSFYDDPSSEGFARSLLDYLLSYVGEPSRDDFRANAVTQIEEFFLSNTEVRVLMVLDGLERVQEDGANSGFDDAAILGELQDKPLRKLLRRLADGIGNVKAVVTSRYPLSDLSNWRGRGYQELKLDRLPLESAIHLLRNRGVQGGDNILTGLVNEFGVHALTLDHLAQILIDYYEGDPRKAAELPSIQTLKGDVHGEKQAQRLARLFRFYEQKLPKNELDVLMILSCFRFPASNDTLKQLLVKEKGRRKISDIQLLNFTELVNSLHGLNNRKLVYIEQADAQQSYITHPAVREYFYRRLTNIQDIHRSVVLVLSKRVPEKLVTYNDDNLNLLEELVYHSVKAGDNRNALSIFLDKMGGYQVIGEKFGTYQRGEAILRTFTPPGHIPPGTPYNLTQQQLSDFYLQRSLFAAELGNMRMAISSLKAHIRRLSLTWQDAEYSKANIKLVNYHILVGELQAAKSLTKSFWVEHNDQLKALEQTDLKNLFYSYRGEELKDKITSYKQERFQELQPLRSCLYILDELVSGMSNLDEVPPAIPGDIWWSLHGEFWNVAIQLRRKPEATARLILKHGKRILGMELNRHAVRWRIMLANAYILKGELNQAEELLNECLDWANRTSSQESIAVSKLNLAKVYIQQHKFIEAENAFRSGQLVAEECGYRLYMIELLNTAAEAMLIKGVPERAIYFAEKSYKLAASEECNFIWGVADALFVKGRALRSLRRVEQAKEVLSKSLQLYNDIQDLNSREVARLI